MNFLCFQLNTLDTQSDSGVKNLAWFDIGNQLFVKHFPKPWKEEAMYQRFRYEDYSPEVYQKFLAVYLNGVPELMKTLS